MRGSTATNPADETREMILLKNLPEDIAIFIRTGYTDLRKSLGGLSSLIEEEYDLNPYCRCITLFCGRKTDCFKMLMSDGDGLLVMTKQLDLRRLKWPRLGGKEAGELWWVTQEQFESLLSGKGLSVEEIDTGEKDEPEINTEPRTLHAHLLRTRKIPIHIYLCTGHTDLRRSIDGYCSIIDSFGLNPEAYAFYLFCGRRNDVFKIVFYDGDGYLLIRKQLENISLNWPQYENEMWDLTVSDFRQLLTGETLDRTTIAGILQRT